MSGGYPDRLGAGAIANTFYDYNTETLSPAHADSTFVYWTDPLAGDNSSATGAPDPGADTSPVLVAETGLNAPAPWVPIPAPGATSARPVLASESKADESSMRRSAFRLLRSNGPVWQ